MEVVGKYGETTFIYLADMLGGPHNHPTDQGRGRARSIPIIIKVRLDPFRRHSREGGNPDMRMRKELDPRLRADDGRGLRGHPPPHITS
jgi:hypothetical protein